MTPTRMIGAILAGLAAGCAPAVQAPPVPSAAAPTKAEAPAKAPAKTASPPAAPVPASQAKTAPPVAARPVPPVAAKAVPPVAAKAPPPVAAAAAPPSLDLKSLEERLKGSNAIGLMTKLSLKNQVDDLLDQFRDYYQGRLKTTLAELRRPYELLLMKVLALPQDADPSLARAIHASREAIWAILADREKFSKNA